MLEALGIDLVTIADLDIDEIRAGAPNTFVTGSQTMVQYVTEDEALAAAIRVAGTIWLARVRRRIHRHAERRVRALGQRVRSLARLAAHPGSAGRPRVRGEPRRDAQRERHRRHGASARRHAARRDALVTQGEAAAAALASSRTRTSPGAPVPAARLRLSPRGESERISRRAGTVHQHALACGFLPAPSEGAPPLPRHPGPRGTPRWASWPKVRRCARALSVARSLHRACAGAARREGDGEDGRRRHGRSGPRPRSATQAHA